VPWIIDLRVDLLSIPSPSPSPSRDIPFSSSPTQSTTARNSPLPCPALPCPSVPVNVRLDTYDLTSLLPPCGRGAGRTHLHPSIHLPTHPPILHPSHSTTVNTSTAPMAKRSWDLETQTGTEKRRLLGELTFHRPFLDVVLEKQLLACLATALTPYSMYVLRRYAPLIPHHSPFTIHHAEEEDGLSTPSLLPFASLPSLPLTPHASLSRVFILYLYGVLRVRCISDVSYVLCTILCTVLCTVHCLYYYLSPVYSVLLHSQVINITALPLQLCCCCSSTKFTTTIAFVHLFPFPHIQRKPSSAPVIRFRVYLESGRRSQLISHPACLLPRNIPAEKVAITKHRIRETRGT